MRIRSHSKYSFVVLGILFLSGAIFLTGCMRPPKFPKRVSVADVVNNARCELYTGVKGHFDRSTMAWDTPYQGEMLADQRAILTYPTSLKDSGQYWHKTNYVNEPPHWLRRWAVSFNMTFTVDRDIDASANLSRVVPITNGTRAIRLKANLDRDATTTFNVKFTIPSLQEWEKYNCSLQEPGSTRRRLLNGELGLERWLNKVLPDIEKTYIQNATEHDSPSRKLRREYEGQLDELTYTIEFGVGMGGEILPSWATTSSGGRQFNPMFLLGKKRVVTHKMIISFARIDLPAVIKKIDLSEVLVKNEETGQFEIISRNVCVLNNKDIHRCKIGPEKLIEDAMYEQRVAEIKKKELEEILDDELKKSEYIGLIEKQKNDLMSIKGGKFNNIPPTIKELISTSKFRDNLKASVDDQYTPAKEILTKLEKAVTDQEVKSLRVKDLIKFKPQLDLRKKSRENARALANSEAKAQAIERTQQRLDRAITNQVIRDSFRVR